MLLIEGRSRISQVISLITQSIWSHAALYIGRLHDIENRETRKKIKAYYQGPHNVPLIIESLLGQGVVVTPLEKYKREHIRICRPNGLLMRDADQIVHYASERLGVKYDTRQVIDLARFLFPWGILPRRWHSSLFAKGAGNATKLSCSALLAEAFEAVDFPILPIVREHKTTGVEFEQRNTRLYTPSDFDYSPFFQIIKYPMIEPGANPLYRHLPWKKSTDLLHDEKNVSIPVTESKGE